MAEDDETQDTQNDEEEAEVGRDPGQKMNDVQRKYLEPLAEDQGEKLKDDMNEAEAAAKIDALQEQAS